MYDLGKRFFDILVSAFVLMCLAPLLLIIMVVLRFTGEGEVFYLQKRIGLKNRYFRIFKFATMAKNSLHMGTGSITLRNDPRVTKVGKYLRMTKLNEFPQLLNVLLGDMSLVGPRPFVDETFQTYPKHVQEHVYDCKPGLTGIGSIVYRDEEAMISQSELPPDVFYRETISPHKGELELWYQKNRSLWVDFLVLCLTVITVFVPNSADLVYQVFPGLPHPKDREVAARGASALG
jgi:lipopolysaccharide/colanic/teichoic acid biosynthesis glycosyltransferase